MKKTGRFLAAAAVFGLLSAGCQGQRERVFSPSENCVYVARDGSVSGALVQNAEGNSVDIKDLKQYLEAAVIRYNKENGGEERSENKKDAERLPAALADVYMKDNEIVAVFEYGSVEDLVKFSQTDDNEDDSHTFSVLEVKKAADAAEELSGMKFKKADGTPVTAEEMAKTEGTFVLSAEGTGVLKVEGKILFLSDNLELKDESTAAVLDGTACIVFK